MSITFVARTMETRGAFIVHKSQKCLLARDTRLLADGIIDNSSIYSNKTVKYPNCMYKH